MIFVVSPGQSIQTAVDAASPGDTILVRAGTYSECVTVDAGDSRLRIVGAGAGKTILDGAGLPAGQPAFSLVRATLVTIAGFTIRNFSGGAGIVLAECNDIVIRENEITGNQGDGVAIESSHRTFVKENRIEKQGLSGIRIDSGSEFTYVVGNKLNHNEAHGIQVCGCHTLVFENEAERNGSHGVELCASEVWVMKNGVRKNTHCGISASAWTEHLFIAGNKVAENGGDGLYLSSGSGHIVFGNTFSRNGGGSSSGGSASPEGGAAGHGLFAASAETLLFANAFEGNVGAGVGVSGSFASSLVLANVITGSGGEGVRTAGGDGDRILSNRIEKNAGAGLFVATADHVVDDNVMRENKGSGILLSETAMRNVLRSNRLKGNTPYDIETQAPAGQENTFDLNRGEGSAPPTTSGG